LVVAVGAIDGVSGSYGRGGYLVPPIESDLNFEVAFHVSTSKKNRVFERIVGETH
jgi:hypothetical protein